MLKCVCGFSMERPGFPLYCKCGRIYYADGTMLDAKAENKPGTELARLIEGDITLGPFHINLKKLGYTPAPGCNCEDRIQLMNRWGVNGCKTHKDEIIAWLQSSAKALGINLHRRIYAALVDLAIHNASRK